MPAFTPTDLVASVLVVEDDPGIARLLRELLTRKGHEVAEVADGALAVPSVHALRPDLVLLDIGLPNVDGLKILETLKGDPRTAAIPVIMVTAWWTPELDVRVRETGAACALPKPFAIDVFTTAVAAAVQAAPSRARAAATAS